MVKEARRRRKNQTPATTKPPTTVNDVPDHLLKLIILRLRSHVSLIRAAAVCTRWRRIASPRNHPADWHRHDFFTVIGHYHVVDPSLSPSPAQRRRPVFVPASPSLDAHYFSLDFLPAGRGGRPWELVDGCGSLLLLAIRRRGFFPDLVVCEPTTRRYVTIQPVAGMKYSRCLGAFLGQNYNVISMSIDFKVTCVLSERAAGMADDGDGDGVGVVTARVYHRRPPWCTRWRSGWHLPRTESSALHVRGAESAHYAGRAAGMIFWGVEDDGTVFACKENSGEFSHFYLPEHVRASHRRSTFRFVNDGTYAFPAKVRVVSLIGDELRVFVERKHDDGSSEWALEKSLRLPEATRGLPGWKECYFGRTTKIVTAGTGFVVVTPAEETWLFSVELGTMRVEREHSRNRLAGEVYPYELRTSPVVRACLVRCRRERTGKCYNICICR
ncbi:hypothetical protein ACP70R_002861 [Stipagrostis hirtigluma subsp. patula]